MLDEKRKLAHSYAVSYEMEVGSSFDPNMEDLSRWEEPKLAPQSTSSSILDSIPEPEDELDFDYDDPSFPSPDHRSEPPPTTTDTYSDEFDADSTWADAYIASFPLDSEPAASECTHAPNMAATAPEILSPSVHHANQDAVHTGFDAPQLLSRWPLSHSSLGAQNGVHVGDGVQIECAEDVVMD